MDHIFITLWVCTLSNIFSLAGIVILFRCTLYLYFILYGRYTWFHVPYNIYYSNMGITLLSERPLSWPSELSHWGPGDSCQISYIKSTLAFIPPPM